MVSKGMKKFFKGKKKGKTGAVTADNTAVPVPNEPEAPAAEVEEPETAPAEEEVRDEPAEDKPVEEEPKEEVEEKEEKEEETKPEEEEPLKAASKDSTVEEPAVTKDPSADETAKEVEAEEEEGEETEEEKLKFKRINTLHAEVTVPLSAKSGDVLDIEHDGNKQIKVPSGQQGKNITVKMVHQDKDTAPETGPFCGCF